MVTDRFIIFRSGDTVTIKKKQRIDRIFFNFQRRDRKIRIENYCTIILN